MDLLFNLQYFKIACDFPYSIPGVRDKFLNILIMFNGFVSMKEKSVLLGKSSLT